MKRDEHISFLTQLNELVNSSSPDRAAFIELMRSYGIPALTKEVRQQCAKCTEPVVDLIPLQVHRVDANEHERLNDERWISLCPTLSTLVLKRRQVFEFRTHGHHFEEKCQMNFKFLNDDEVWDIIISNPEAMDLAIERHKVCDQFQEPNKSDQGKRLL